MRAGCRASERKRGGRAGERGAGRVVGRRSDHGDAMICGALALTARRCTSSAAAAVPAEPYGTNDAGGFRNVLPAGRERPRQRRAARRIPAQRHLPAALRRPAAAVREPAATARRR